MVFCNTESYDDSKNGVQVTILILIDGFLQYIKKTNRIRTNACHNPYFNRWFSAISNMKKYMTKLSIVTILILIDGFLQYGVPKR